MAVECMQLTEEEAQCRDLLSANWPLQTILDPVCQSRLSRPCFALNKQALVLALEETVEVWLQPSASILFGTAHEVDVIRRQQGQHRVLRGEPCLEHQDLTWLLHGSFQDEAPDLKDTESDSCPECLHTVAKARVNVNLG